MISYVVVDLGLGPVLAGSLGTVVHPEAGITLAASFVFGPAGIFGSALGYAVSDLLRGGISAFTGVGYLATGVFGCTAYGLRATPDLDAGTIRRQLWRFLPSLGVITLIAATIATATIAWGGEVFATYRFAPVVREQFGAYVIGGLLVGVPAVLLLSALSDRFEASYEPEWHRTNRLFRPRWKRRSVAFLFALGWCVTGFAVSVVTQPIKLTYLQLLENRLGTTIGTVVNLVGSNSRYAQIAFGGIVLVCYLWVLLYYDAGTEKVKRQ